MVGQLVPFYILPTISGRRRIASATTLIFIIYEHKWALECTFLQTDGQTSQIEGELTVRKDLGDNKSLPSNKWNYHRTKGEAYILKDYHA